MMQLAEIKTEIEWMKNRIIQLETEVSIREQVAQVTSESPKDLYYQISMLLKEIGFPVHISGYGYTREAIMMVMDNQNLIGQMTKLVYPGVARKFNTTGSRVERAIRHAIEVTWSKKMNDRLYELYPGAPRHDRPTNTEFIAGIVDSLLLMGR